MRTRVATSVAALVLSGLAVPVALADVPPPITVPTPTVPAPQPDPGPVSKPRPKTTPQPRPSVHRPAASPSPAVTPSYTPPATVTPKPQVSSHPHKKRLPVKHKKAKPAAKKPTVKQQGVNGAEKTAPVTHPVTSQDTSPAANWPRTALFFILALILGAIAVLRYRRVHPRVVDLEVLEPQALRAAQFPLGRPGGMLAPTQQALGALEAERPAELLLADIAPPVSEDQETEVESDPAEARPVAPGQEEKPFYAATPGFEDDALQSHEPDADDVAMTDQAEEICTIAIWHGYVKSRFYARLVGDDEQGIEYALAESEPIRLRGNGTPERTEEAEKGHTALVNQLIESGWEVEPAVNGDSWHDLRFHRAVVPADSNVA